VYRHEIWAAVKEENRAAAETSVKDLPRKQQ
jgi:sRNA-binding carbon storage regulator CsrA